MANTLTNLIPDLYAGLDTVSRELTGFIPAASRDSTAERAAVGEAVRYHIAPEATSSNISPAMQVPEPTDQTIGSDTVTITKAKAAEFGFVGEEQLGLDNGSGYGTVQGDMFAQALRVLVNEVEADLAAEAHGAASFGVGTAGTTPFGTNTSGVADLRKGLIDRGAPVSDLQLILDTTAGASLRTLYGINTDRDWSNVPINERGVLSTPHGVSIRESGYEIAHTKGTAASATTNTDGYAKGDTVITLASAGTGTIVEGDVVKFAGDDNGYVVTSGDADVSGGGTITIESPGLLKAIPAAATGITVQGSHSANIGFYRRALQLVTRAPARPREGDLALDARVLVDPISGLAFEVAMYPGYRKVRFEVALAWGTKATQARHIGKLMG